MKNPRNSKKEVTTLVKKKEIRKKKKVTTPLEKKEVTTLVKKKEVIIPVKKKEVTKPVKRKEIITLVKMKERNQNLLKNSIASPPQSPLQEDQLAQILANMSEYIQPHSPLNLNIEIDQLQEQVVINKDTAEEIPDEENPQGTVEPTRVNSPEECSQEHGNTKEMSQTENIEANLGEGTATGEQTLAEQPSTEKGTTVPSKKKKKTN